MAMSRKSLKAMGLTEEQVESIVEMNAESLSGLKDKLVEAEDKADKAAALQKQLDEANEKIKAFTADDYKARYESEHAEHDKTKAEFEKLKTDIAGKETLAKKQAAYKALLTKANLPEKYHTRAMRGIDFDGMELDDKGAVKNAKKYTEDVQNDWKDEITHVETTGADTANPPSNIGGTTKSKKDILAIKDTAERQKAIAENHELFGF